MKFKIFLLLLLIICQIYSQFTLTNSAKKLSSYQTLTLGVSYEFNFTLNKVITSGSSVSITFPSEFRIPSSVLTNCQASRLSTVALASATCSSVYSSGLDVYSIVFSGIYTAGISQTFLWLKFNINNPWSQTSSRIDVYIKDPSSSTLESVTFYIDFTASILSSCSINGATQITGDSVSQTIKFTPNKDLIAGSYLLISLPMWFMSSSSISNLGSSSLTCVGIQNTDSSTLPCSIFNLTSTTQAINVTNFISTNKTTPGQISIQLQNLRNPWNLAPFGQIKYQIYYLNAQITQRCTGIYRTVTSPNVFKSLSFNITSLSISSINTGIQLILGVQNPAMRNRTRIRIDHSNQITITYSGSSILLSQKSDQIIFTNMATSDRIIGSIFIISFITTTPPSTRPFTIKFTSQFVDSTGTLFYDIDSSSRTWQNTAGTITSGNVVVTDKSINTITSYQISFTITNKLISGSFIQIMFPSSLLIDSTAVCNDNITNSSTCVINSNNITITINGSISASTSFLVNVDKVKNSADTLQTPSFKIYSYYDSLYDSLVDMVETGITVTMTANPITGVSINAMNKTTYTITGYEFNFTIQDNIPQNGYIQIQFPSTVVPVSGSLLLDSASFSKTTCSLSLSNQIIKILNCFLTSGMANKLVSLTISGIRNPPSYQPSNTFKIRTYSNSASLLNYISSGVTVTMNNPYTLNSFIITPQNSTVHTYTKNTIDIVHIIPLSINDYVIINIDNSMNISTSITCTALSGLSAINCIRVSNSQLKVIYTSTLSSQTLKYSIQNIRNYDIADTNLIFNLQTYSSNNYLKQKSSASFAYGQSMISVYNVNNNDKIILYDYSQITISVSSPFGLDSSFDITKTKLSVYLPSGMSSATNSTCTASFGTCLRISSTKYDISQVGLSFTNYLITMNNILLPFINGQSNSFSIVYSYNGNNVSIVQTGVVVKPFCLSPCKKCDIINTKCVNCMPDPNTFKYFDLNTFTCSLNCPNTTYPDNNNVCQNCVSPCKNCEDIVNCTSCISNKWLFQKSCLSTCPNTHFNASNGLCQLCVSPCKTCKSSTECLTCVTGYYYNYKCVSQKDCPSNTYANSTTLKCQSCLSPCSNCSKSESNCTSCVSSYFYYSNLCVLNCPNTMYKSGIFCVTCNSPCSTCTNATYCLTCLIKYYYNGTCIQSTQCPIGTYPNSTQLKCIPCNPGCTSCSSSTNCSSCDINFYLFYQYSCLTSCPDSTYKSGYTCSPCSSPCQNCQNTSTLCLSCIDTTYLYNNKCYDQCPIGTYSDINKCISCKIQCYNCTNSNTCISCALSYYLTSTNQCVTNCPSRYYQNTSNNTCSSCTSPCSDCDQSATNCTSCISTQILYQNNCNSTTCPPQYFNVSGVCKTCQNCINCVSADTCKSCINGYFIYVGICYSKCPISAPIPDYGNRSCIVCDQSCKNCQGTTTTCTSCKTGQYLFNYGCYSSCPIGYIQDVYKRTCQPKQLSSIFYFPSLFCLISLTIILIYSKITFPQTQFVTNFTAILSLCCFLSWLIYASVVYLYQITLQQSIINIFILVTLITISISIILGLIYQIYIKIVFQSDPAIMSWKQHDSLNYKIFIVVTIGSIFNYIFYRFLYARLFHRQYFTLCFSNGQKLLSTTHRISLFTILIQLLPMIAVTFYTIYNKQIYDQTVYSALDSLVLNVLLIILLLIDGSKSGQQYFASMKKKLPFISDFKDKYLQVDSMASILDSQDLINKKRRIKTQINKTQKQKYFRKITCIDNLNKFGHLNQIENQQILQTKSLPQLKKLKKLPSYDPNYQFEQDLNVMDDFFFQDSDQIKLQKKRQAQKIKKQLELQQQRIQKQRKLQQQKLAQQQRLQQQRLAKILEDQKQQQNLQCIDLVAIDKAQNKNKNSLLQLLSKCKTVNDKPIQAKQLKKLEDIAKKNGINPDFMKQTFGVQKHHNQQLLNSIIDKHNHVNRDAVKQMFKQTNNKQILQELFSKNSNLNTEKLKNIMNDKEGLKMIQKLMDQQKGIVSPQIAKLLFDKNSKFNPQFTKKLLSGETGADDKKLQQLLRNTTNQKQKQANLKALKKIGGDSLQNKEILRNMLGQQSKLDPQQFSKVANNLSMKAIQNIFKKQSPYRDEVVQKILNNKKLNLKQLTPIFEDQQLFYELGKQLANGNQIIQQNLMNLLKNINQDIDPQKLKSLIKNPIIMQKLLGNSTIDPQFLTQILTKNRDINFQLLSKTLQSLPPGDIQKIFQFTGQKNTDYKALSQLFNKGSNTDPELVKKMLDPKIVSQIYTKNNNIDPKILSKLVEKGSKFDKQNIINIYGKNTNSLFNQNQIDNNQLGQDKQLSYGQGDETQYDYKYNFNRTANYNQNFNMSEAGDLKKKQSNNNQIIMSRTDGGMMGFLNHTKIKQQKNKIKQSSNLIQDDQYDNLSDQIDDQAQTNAQYQFGKLEQAILQQQDEDGSPHYKKKKITIKKRKLKKVTDIRHPSQKIYLEPIIAPHQLQMSKQFRNKKKRDPNRSATKLIMDEDNDVFDIDF